MNRKEVLRLIVSLLCIAVFLIIIFYPYSHLKIWREYEGFDKNIIYINPKGYLQNTGNIEVKSKMINITALPRSQPTIHLIGTELRNFNVTFKVRILNDNADFPFQAKLWEPRTSIVAINFESASKKIFIDIINKQSDNSHFVTRIPTIYYSLNQEYSINMHIERPDAIYISLNTTVFTLNNKFLFLNASNGIIQLQSEIIEIKPNTTYSLKTLIYPLEGNNVFLLNLQWLDEHGTPLYFSGDWFPLDNKLNKTLNGWYEVETTYVAPSAAKYAKIVFGIDKSNIALLDNLTLIDANNGKSVVFYDFNNKNVLDLFEALSLPSKESIDILQFLKVNKVYIVTSDMTNLLEQERIALSFFATNTRSDGISQAIVSDYKVIILDNKGWYSSYIDSSSAIPIYMFATIFYGLFLILFHKNNIMGILTLTKKFNKGLLKEAIPGLKSKKALLTILTIGGVYFIGIIIGFHLYDVYSMITWSYAAANYGLKDIYLLPAITSSAPSDGGDPYNYFGFPYLMLSVYIFYIIGFLRKLLPIETASPIFFDSTFVLMIKIFSLIFIIFDAILVYKILKHPTFKYSINSRSKAVLLFLLNPLIISDVIIWGQIDSILLFFMLLVIYFLLDNKHEYAWLSLLIFMLLKQTSFIIGIFMSFLLMLFYPKKSIIKGLPFGIAIIFFILLPLFIIGFSPSTVVLPLVSKTLQFGTLSNMEKLSAFTTRDFTNMWALLTFIMGARGRQIFSFPDYINVWGSITPYHIGVLLTFIFSLVIVAKVIFIKLEIRQNTLKHEDIVIKYIIITTAILTLTLLIFFTRITARWLIFPVTLLLLLYEQKTLNSLLWKLYFIITMISSVSILSVIAVYQNILSKIADLISQFIINDLLFDSFILVSSLLVISFYLLLFYNFIRGKII